MRHLSKSRFSLCLLFVTYLIVLIGYDQLLYEWIQEYYYLIVTNEDIKKYPDAKRMFDFQNLEVQKDINGVKKPVILMWRPRFGGVSRTPEICDNCLMTYDQTAISEADAVVFHCSDTSDMRERYPWTNRDPKQRWVWYCMEPPWMLRYLYERKLTDLSGVFNWTLTYRTDSHVYGSYIMNLPHTTRESLESLLKRKTLMVSWVVSNCRSKKRNDLVKELSKYVSVDIFGECAGERIGSTAAVIVKYKFYLAFENSQCKDYITEKLGDNSLQVGTVPVVMGPPKSQYELIAPPSSFIHVDDFKSMEELAGYLNKLDKDDEAYRKYLEWRLDSSWREQKKAQFPSFGQSGMCGVCDKLHQTSNHTDVVEDLAQWWYGEGYKPNDPHFPICSNDSSPNGYSLHWVVTLIYSVVFGATALAILCIAYRPCKGRVFRCRPAVV